MIKYTATLILAAASIAGAGMAIDKSDHLQPDQAVFAGTSPIPYHLALRETLLGEHNTRLCQVLAVTSFEPEWAMYLVREDDGRYLLIYKAMKKNLWSHVPHISPAL